MGNIGRRIEALERSLGTKATEEISQERRRIIEELEEQVGRWRRRGARL